MGSCQDGSGLLVVKVFGIEQDEDRVLTLVFGVAHRTLLTLVPMIPAFLCHALGDLQMTRQASLVGDLEVLVVALHAVDKADGLGMCRAERAGGIILAVVLGRRPHSGGAYQEEKNHTQTYQ
jgi:hypothetical protein